MLKLETSTCRTCGELKHLPILTFRKALRSAEKGDISSAGCLGSGCTQVGYALARSSSRYRAVDSTAASSPSPSPPRFADLVQLVHHYMRHPLATRKRRCCLSYPLTRPVLQAFVEQDLFDLLCGRRPPARPNEASSFDPLLSPLSQVSR